nr:efflux RND transporter permease subunit [Gemmatimonadota bacterium]
MFISDFAIKKPVVTITVMVALVVFGIVALFMLDTDEFPEVNPPVVAISVPYPGASPEGVEREIVDPIEEAISGISGVDDINSQALDGFASIIVIFDFAKDLQQATQDIRDAISGIRGDLPLEMREPILTRFDPNDLPIVSLALASSQLSAPELSRIADPGLTRQLRGINGVAQVNVVGALERELTVELRPEALQAAGVGVGQVVGALQQQNLAVPVGRLSGDLNERTIRLRGRLESPRDFEQLVVTQSAGRVVRLGDVATIRDATEEPRSLALFNGEQAVGIDIVKATNASTTAVSERVRERIEEIQQTLPAGVTLRIVQDAGVRVKRSVEQVQSALLEGAFLTVLVVFLFLNSWRSTVITGLALPVSVLASFIAVWAFGFTLNTMSLLGLSLAIGILIDDAIVVRENIVRHVEMGKDHYTASREGTSEIGLAVAATTFAIVCVFVPIAFMGGIAQQWFAPFALTIACSVLVSLFVSFSLDPMLSAYWPDPHLEEHEKSRITRGLDRFNRWFDRQAEGYKRLIGWALDHRSAMVLIALGSFVLALAIPQRGASGFLAGIVVLTAIVLVLVRLQPNRWIKLGLVLGGIPLMIVASRMVPVVGKLGSEFFPKQDRSEFSLKIETPPGSNLDYTRIKAEEAARMARTHREVQYTYTTIGGRGGAVDEATVYIALVPKKQRAVGQQELEQRVRGEVARIGGAQV